jgi:hypothetical protein
MRKEQAESSPTPYQTHPNYGGIPQPSHPVQQKPPVQSPFTTARRQHQGSPSVTFSTSANSPCPRFSPTQILNEIGLTIEAFKRCSREVQQSSHADAKRRLMLAHEQQPSRPMPQQTPIARHVLRTCAPIVDTNIPDNTNVYPSPTVFGRGTPEISLSGKLKDVIPFKGNKSGFKTWTKKVLLYLHRFKAVPMVLEPSTYPDCSDTQESNQGEVFWFLMKCVMGDTEKLMLRDSILGDPYKAWAMLSQRYKVKESVEKRKLGNEWDASVLGSLSGTEYIEQLENINDRMWGYNMAKSEDQLMEKVLVQMGSPLITSMTSICGKYSSQLRRRHGTN